MSSDPAAPHGGAKPAVTPPGRRGGAQRDAQGAKDDASLAVPADDAPILASAPTPASADDGVPQSLRVAAAWSWRLIVVGVVLYALGNVLALLGAIVLPLVIALLIAAPLERLVTRMERIKIPRALGAVLSVLALVTTVLGLAVGVGASVVAGFDDLYAKASAGVGTLVAWLAEGPIHLSEDRVNSVLDQVGAQVEKNAWGLASGALSVTGTMSALAAGVVLALISLFFFLQDGQTMWKFFVGIAPRGAREGMDLAGRAGWDTLRRYTQTSVFVAFIDALGIGIGAWALGVPLALPLAIFVFLFSFIPLFGAGISGAVAVLVALVDGGWAKALLMLLVVMVVQQLEGNVLYPWLFGKAASVHPMAIMLSVSAGTLLAGLAGAVIAVPILAFGVAAVRGLHREYVASQGSHPPVTLQLPVLAGKSVGAIKRVATRVTTGTIRVRKQRG